MRTCGGGWCQALLPAGVRQAIKGTAADSCAASRSSAGRSLGLENHQRCGGTADHDRRAGDDRIPDVRHRAGGVRQLQFRHRSAAALTMLANDREAVAINRRSVVGATGIKTAMRRPSGARSKFPNIPVSASGSEGQGRAETSRGPRLAPPVIVRHSVTPGLARHIMSAADYCPPGRFDRRRE